MRKWILSMLILTLAITFIGCKPSSDSNTDQVTSVKITSPKTEIDIDEEVELYATLSPTGSSGEVLWTSSNTEIITVDSNGLVKGISLGTANITATLKGNPTKQDSVTISVTGPLADPESVELTSTKTEVSKGSYITIISTVLPSNASQNVVYESSDEVIATVDSDGKVRGHELGVVTITVKVVANLLLTDTIDINVVEAQIPGGTLDPEQVIIVGESEVFEGTTITLSASVYPSGASQNVVWESNNPTIATVNSEGVVTGLKEGDAYITATSAVNASFYDMRKITVKPEAVVADYPDLGGYEIVIMSSPGHTNDHDPFHESYTSLDKTAKQEAWLEVQQNFNCTISVIEYPMSAPWGPIRASYIVEKASLNQSEADIMVTTYEWIKILADGNGVIDVSDYYNTYGQNQMYAALKNATSYKDGLYGLIPNNVGGLNVDKGMYYNVELVESLGLDSPAKLFNDGDWTYSGFEAYAKNAATLLGDGQTVFAGKPVLYWIGMTNAAGVKLVDTVSLDVNFNNQYATQSASILRGLYQEIGWGDMGFDALASSFNDGNSIFQAAELWFLKSADRWPTTIWNDSGHSEFGYVPFPYPDDMDKEQTRTSFSFVIASGDGQCYMMANGRDYPAGVNAEYVYHAFTEMMLNTGKNLRNDVTFDEETTMRTVAEKKLDDLESVEAISFFTRSKVMFDPIYNLIPYATDLSPALEQIVVDGADYNQIIDALIPMYENRMTELYS